MAKKVSTSQRVQEDALELEIGGKTYLLSDMPQSKLERMDEIRAERDPETTPILERAQAEARRLRGEATAKAAGIRRDAGARAELVREYFPQHASEMIVAAEAEAKEILAEGKAEADRTVNEAYREISKLRGFGLAEQLAFLLDATPEQFGDIGIKVLDEALSAINDWFVSRRGRNAGKDGQRSSLASDGERPERPS